MSRDGSLPRHRNERERAFIEALAPRYAEVPPADRAVLDSAYTRGMKAVAEAYPDDLEAAVLYAESEMDLRPWDYWQPDATPHPGIDDALATLRSVIERNGRPKRRRSSARTWSASPTTGGR